MDARVKPAHDGRNSQEATLKNTPFDLTGKVAVITGSSRGEWGPKGVRINCVAPGLVKTDFAKALWEDEERLKRRCATTPLRRIGEPDEIAGAVAYLGSDASSFMTGQTIVVDGGVTTASA
jgi:enoyl-[acyl-carrier-protein] reductase (NADH)